MSDENTTITAPAATDDRECTIKLLTGQMDGVQAIRDDRIKWLGEATDLLKQLAMGVAQPHPADHFLSRDAAAREAR